MKQGSLQLRVARFSDRKDGHPNRPATQILLGTIVGDSTMKNVRRYFSQRIKKVASGCIEWQGCCDGGGYGDMYCNGKLQKAHRYSYQLFKGTIPRGFSVCHTCDNPKCVNPDHLFTGTHSDNMKDMYAKGRGNRPTGEKHHSHRLTWEQVRFVRDSKESSRQLGKKYGVTHQAILKIKNYITWREIDLPKETGDDKRQDPQGNKGETCPTEQKPD